MLRSAVTRKGKPIVLILDQFEQFFVQFQEAERALFIGALKDWYESDVAVKILIGIRGDLSDRLIEIHKALGYSLRPSQVYRLEKFAPEQATEVLRVIAETEKWSFNEAFVLEMARDQLSGLDGKVAPVEVQVLAQMVSREPSEENRRLDKTSFQKLGGVDGLLGRSLERSLKTILGKADRDRALQVLLALTDLERNVRSGAFSVVQLQEMTEKVHGSPSEVMAAVDWLSESRLITPGDGDGAVVYELAHERLIPALRQVANQELTDANKANLLLDRRVNEWLGSGKSRRYLFSLKELGLLRSQRGFLEWGQRRSQKEALVKKSWNRARLNLGGIGTPLGMGLIFLIWSNTPSGQLQWTRWEIILDRYPFQSKEVKTAANLDMISGVSHELLPDLWLKWFAVESYDFQIMNQIIQTISKIKNRDSAKQILGQIELVVSSYPDRKSEKSVLLSQLSVAWVDLQEIEISRRLLDSANKVITKRVSSNGFVLSIKDESSHELSSIAAAYGKLGDTEKGKKILEKALEVTKSIKDESSQSSELSSIAEVYGKLGDTEKGKQILEKALEVTKSIKDESSPINELSSIAEVYGKLGDAEKGKQVLEKALEVVKLIDKYLQNSGLRSIAEASGKLGDAERGRQVLEKALEITMSIKNEDRQSSGLRSIAEASGKLDDTEKSKQVLEKALELTKSIKNEDYQIFGLISIAEVYGKLGDPEKGKQVLEKALELTKSIKDEYSQINRLSAIVETSSELGDVEKGKQVLEKALELTKSIKDEYNQNQGLSSIAKSYLELGDRPRALSMLSDITRSGKIVGSKTNRIISVLHAELGNPGEALHFAKRCGSSSDKNIALAEILRIHAEKQHPEFRELRIKNEE